MADFFDRLEDKHIDFIKEQHIFFVATAPLAEDGHINLSPKGHDAFRVFSPNKVGYLDLTGSGNETAAHLMENGRITFMFCAFKGPADILRLYGRGYTIQPGTPEWDEYSPHFDLLTGTRQIIMADIHKVQTSCGYAVPFYEYTGDRQTLVKWAENKGDDGLVEYRTKKNVRSLDGLPTPLATE